MAYFSGMFIGFVIELVVELAIGILFTRGLLTLETLMAKLDETFKALGSLLMDAVKLPFKATEKTVSSLAKGLKSLYEFLSKGTEEILKIIDEVFLGLKSKIVLSGRMTYSFVDPITIFLKFFYNYARKKWWQQLHDLGVAVAKNEEGLYTFLYKNEDIATGLSQSEVESYLKELFSKTQKSADEAKKYLDNLAERNVKLKSKIVNGWYSKRDFDINNCGGKILNLTWEDTKITNEGIEIVKKHLSRFEYDDWNERMIVRLEKILKHELELTDFDKRFFTHETREFERYKNLGHENSTWKNLSKKEFRELWDNAHAATLEDYKIYEKIEYQGNNVYSLYHPEVQF